MSAIPWKKSQLPKNKVGCVCVCVCVYTCKMLTVINSVGLKVRESKKIIRTSDVWGFLKESKQTKPQTKPNIKQNKNPQQIPLKNQHSKLQVCQHV